VEEGEGFEAGAWGAVGRFGKRASVEPVNLHRLEALFCLTASFPLASRHSTIIWLQASTWNFLVRQACIVWCSSTVIIASRIQAKCYGGQRLLTLIWLHFLLSKTACPPPHFLGGHSLTGLSSRLWLSWRWGRRSVVDVCHFCRTRSCCSPVP
jgi:hypothetical protein